MLRLSSTASKAQQANPELYEPLVSIATPISDAAAAAAPAQPDESASAAARRTN